MATNVNQIGLNNKAAKSLAEKLVCMYSACLP